MASTKPAEGYGDIREFRRTELATKKLGKLMAKSVWQMQGAGSLGGQALLGIAAARRVLESLGAAGAVWPFATAWRAQTPADIESLSALFIEIYAPLYPAKPEPGDQVRRCASSPKAWPSSTRRRNSAQPSRRRRRPGQGARCGGDRRGLGLRDPGGCWIERQWLARE